MRSFALGARLETWPLITCLPFGTLGSQLSGTSVSVGALLYLGVIRLDASAAKFEKSPETTRTWPAGSISFHQDPLAPNLFLSSGLMLPVCSGATLLMCPEVGPLGHPLLCFQTAPNMGQAGPVGLPGRHFPCFSSHPHFKEDWQLSQVVREMHVPY